MKHYLAGVRKRLGGDFLERGYTVTDAISGIESGPLEVPYPRYFGFNTEPDDPLGTYTIEVIVDGAVVDALDYEVVEGGDPDKAGGEPPGCPRFRPDRVRRTAA